MDTKIYIRKEDLDKWNAIEKKSEWLHEHLNGAGNRKLTLPKAPVKDLAERMLCSHLAAPGFCKVRKCANSVFNPKNRNLMG